MDKKHISRIVVKGLFGRYDYDINLETGLNTAIITAPNGHGKTTIFRFINFIFNPSIDTFNEINKVPISEFRIILNNRIEIVLIREGCDWEIPKTSRKAVQITSNVLKSVYTRLYDSSYNYILEVYKDEQLKDATDFKSLTIEFLSSSAGIMAYMSDPDIYDYRDTPSIRQSKIQSRQRERMISQVIERLNRGKEHYYNIPVLFIKADRIGTPEILNLPEYVRDHISIDSERLKSPLVLASESIAEDISKTMSEYDRLMDDAKSELPKAYLKGKKSDTLSNDEFTERWTNYHSELEKYYNIGLLMSADPIIEERNLSEVYHDHAIFLTKYVQTYEKTLKPLEDVYDNLKLFADIFNKRNKTTSKEIKFDREGIKVTSYGEDIKLTDLSSGEQNDFIMFYDLIFQTEENTIILIDEPEISLHISWQEDFVDYILKICGENNQAILATHSPNIVSSHYDLIVDKGGTYA